MIVVDTNVLVYAVIQSPETPLAQRVAARDAEWAFPPLWRYEFTSAVATLIRGRALTVAQAEDGIREAERVVGGREFAVDQIAALGTAMTFNLSAYDAQYIRLAQSLGVRCVTTDNRMLRNAPGIAISLADFVAGPTGP